MTDITDKIAALPRPAGRFFKPRSEWLTMKLYRAEAERDLALEALRRLRNVRFSEDVAEVEAAYEDACAVLAACGKGEG